MNSAKTSDVKRHLSTHDRLGKALYHPESQPDATGFSGEESRQADGELVAEELSRGPGPSEEEAEQKSLLAPDSPKSVQT